MNLEVYCYTIITVFPCSEYPIIFSIMTMFHCLCISGSRHHQWGRRPSHLKIFQNHSTTVLRRRRRLQGQIQPFTCHREWSTNLKLQHPGLNHQRNSWCLFYPPERKRVTGVFCHQRRIRDIYLRRSVTYSLCPMV